MPGSFGIDPAHPPPNAMVMFITWLENYFREYRLEIEVVQSSGYGEWHGVQRGGRCMV